MGSRDEKRPAAAVVIVGIFDSEPPANRIHRPTSKIVPRGDRADDVEEEFFEPGEKFLGIHVVLTSCQ